MHGFGLHAKFDVPFYHINHGRGGGGLFDGKNRKMNDQYRAIIAQNKTQNNETWGFADTEIEFEVF
jgi:hypothetical protein